MRHRRREIIYRKSSLLAPSPHLCALITLFPPRLHCRLGSTVLCYVCNERVDSPLPRATGGML